MDKSAATMEQFNENGKRPAEVLEEEAEVPMVLEDDTLEQR